MSQPNINKTRQEQETTPECSPTRKRSEKVLTEIMSGIFITEQLDIQEPKEALINKLNTIKAIFKTEAYLTILLFSASVALYMVSRSTRSVIISFFFLSTLLFLPLCLFQSIIQIREVIKGIYPKKSNTYPSLRTTLKLRKFSFAAAFTITAFGLAYSLYLLLLNLFADGGYAFDFRILKFGRMQARELINQGVVVFEFFILQSVLLIVNWIVCRRFEMVLDSVEVKELLY